MPLNVYISYGIAADQVTALRLQALGAVNGLEVYVPPAHTRQLGFSALDEPLIAMIGRADFVLGVIAGQISEACSQELKIAKQFGKTVIVMADPATAAQLRALGMYHPSNIVVINPADPATAESQIVDFLTTIDAQQDNKNALLALGTIAIGLLLLAVATKD